MTRTDRGDLILPEYGSLSGVELTATQADAIASSTARIEVRPTTRVGRYDLHAGHTVGVLVLPELQVVIRPKLPVRRLLHLLGYFEGFVDWESVAELDRDVGLLEAMQEQYSRLLGSALFLGLVREYRTQVLDHHGLRGRADLLHVSTRRFGVFPPVRCEVDEFTEDTVPNRLMLAAATALARATTGYSEPKARLEALASRMSGVALERFAGTGVPEPILDRRHWHCVDAIRMAQLVLRSMSVELREGRTASVAFLVDMNAVYEDFVALSLRESLGVSSQQWKRHPGGVYLDTERKVRLVPDVLWTGPRGESPIVLDVKYKVASGPMRADIYQIATYATAMGARDAVLVYASNTTDTFHVVRSGVRIHQVAFDPDGEPEELMERASALAVWLRGLRTRRAGPPVVRA